MQDDDSKIFDKEHNGEDQTHQEEEENEVHENVNDMYFESEQNS